MVFGISHLANAQKKYAVLITGDYAATPNSIPESDLWNGGINEPEEYDEFWNDTYLMWEMLQEKGFSQENIIVLFAGGEDYSVTNQNIADRYKPEQGVTVTDYSASIANVNAVFNGLANGTGDFPEVTPDDFLLVWTFDHGGLVNGNATLHLIDGAITDDDFASLVNPIQANKKAFWMEQCHSGGFANELEGPTTFFQSACQEDESAWRANDTPEIENEIINNIPYHHGEFSFHVFSVANGSSPTGSLEYDDTPYTDADENNDNYLSLYEIWEWADDQEDNPNAESLLSDDGDIGEYTSLEYPTLLHTNMTSSETHRGIIGISKSFSVQSGSELTFMTNSKVDILNGSEITVQSYATLTIGQNTQFTNGKIIIEEHAVLNINSDVNLDNVEIELHNSALSTTGITLDNQSKIWLFGLGTYEILYSKFYNGSQVLGVNNQGSVLVQNCKFYDSFIHIDNNMMALNCGVSIINNLFSNSATQTAIRIDGCDTYDINNNTIDLYEDGIEIWNSGFGKGNYYIRYNTVTNLDGTAITFYGSSGIIENNSITDNNLGVQLLNNSVVSLVGNSNASTESQTQVIKNNVEEEIYMSSYSVPHFFHYNFIEDYDNLGGEADPLVFHDLPPSGQPIINVENNCWGANFDPLVDLYPVAAYDSDPIWCPGGGIGILKTAEELYILSQDQFLNEDYTSSKSTLETIIDEYPETKFAQAAIKDLFIVELFASNDYSALQQYYANNPTIQSDAVLQSLSEFFINKCDVKLENWQTAIDFYESRITESPDSEEGIFAIIDLGLLYSLMENSGNKASVGIGSMPEYKPASLEEYKKNREYLISLLPFKSSTNNDNTRMNEGVLSQNFPNPFTGKTQIYYKLESKSIVQISIYNYTGQLIKLYEEGVKAQGAHYINFDANGLENGIYLYSIIIDGQIIDSKKMTIMK